jgi:hypothetical protein
MPSILRKQNENDQSNISSSNRSSKVAAAVIKKESTKSFSQFLSGIGGVENKVKIHFMVDKNEDKKKG